jgi:hypothetical protein
MPDFHRYRIPVLGTFLHIVCFLCLYRSGKIKKGKGKKKQNLHVLLYNLSSYQSLQISWCGSSVAALKWTVNGFPENTVLLFSLYTKIIAEKFTYFWQFCHHVKFYSFFFFLGGGDSGPTTTDLFIALNIVIERVALLLCIREISCASGWLDASSPDCFPQPSNEFLE